MQKQTQFYLGLFLILSLVLAYFYFSSSQSTSSSPTVQVVNGVQIIKMDASASGLYSLLPSKPVFRSVGK
ncbi:hypothetical protein COU93_00870 [Candidatus Shapirobacteria bacterium CG10_big_fil_rev_8_21_14_0_10_36_6]|uniref:Uncharacterized protein n=1 Tax=Candidatus Shapirobacteria bacterium CG10_big_fil_rev_8_21_14_0_10_36_6 TaxID=1974886 RepID=A0A2M8L2D5_9BACT|nr:MAG: hypothetical protein COU93_00870 [Candidatus Shapirobacteria bacterium CG10_big_fil_rev_8_21_14_0_10_36_6]